MVQEYAEPAAGVVAVLGSAIAFFPTWWGGWEQANVTTWIGAVATMLLAVWLYVLARRLFLDGHRIHAAIVIGLVLLPVLGMGTHIVAGQREFTVSSVSDALQLLYGGVSGLIAPVGLVVMAILDALGILFPQGPVRPRGAR
jgi:hypothetical protein